MRKLLWMSVMVGAVALTSSCAYLLPDTTPTMFGLLADRGDTRPFEKPLPMGRRHALLAATSAGAAVAIRENDGSLWTWGRGYSQLGNGSYNEIVEKPTKLQAPVASSDWRPEIPMFWPCEKMELFGYGVIIRESSFALDAKWGA